MASEAGKGSGRRKEDTKRYEENHGEVKWGVRDKANDTFKVNIKGGRAADKK